MNFFAAFKPSYEETQASGGAGGVIFTRDASWPRCGGYVEGTFELVRRGDRKKWLQATCIHTYVRTYIHTLVVALGVGEYESVGG